MSDPDEVRAARAFNAANDEVEDAQLMVEQWDRRVRGTGRLLLFGAVILITGMVTMIAKDTWEPVLLVIFGFFLFAGGATTRGDAIKGQERAKGLKRAADRKLRDLSTFGEDESA